MVPTLERPSQERETGMVRSFGIIRWLVAGVVLILATACAAYQSPLGAIGQAEIPGSDRLLDGQLSRLREYRAVLDDTIESDLTGDGTAGKSENSKKFRMRSCTARTQITG